MQKVLCVGNHFYPKGGSDRYMINLYELLLKRQHEAIPFSSKHRFNKSNNWERYFPEYLDTTKLGIQNGYQLIYSKKARQHIGRLLDAEPIDIAHLNIFSQFTSSILSPLKDRGIPIVQTLHDYKPICPTYSLYRNGQLCEECSTKGHWNAIRHKCSKGSLTRTIATVAETYFSESLGSIEKIDHFITVCEFQRKKLLKYNALKGKKITTVPNFIELKNYVEQYSPGDYLLYFGRIETIKGIWTLIRAMAPLKQFKLIVAGEGEEKRELQKFVEKKQLDHITILPFQKQGDLVKLISGSLCTVLASEVYELCPMSVLESLALSRMVIAAHIGGIPELIKDNENGMLFKPKSIEELRERITEAFSDKIKTRRLGESGRECVEKHYNADQHYDRIMEIYGSLK